MLEMVERIGKQEVTVVSSLDVAETFEKEHYQVLKDIRRIMADIGFPPPPR